MSETSPTPWKVVKEIGKDQTMPFLLTTTCEDEWNVAAIFGDVPHLPAEANAAFIAHAVNCHAEMVEALKIADEHLRWVAAGQCESSSSWRCGRDICNVLGCLNEKRMKVSAALARATQTNTGE